MAPLQQPLGHGADLLGLLQLAGRYAQLQFLQRLPRPLHRLHPHGLLVARRSSESTMITLMPAIPEGTS